MTSGIVTEDIIRKVCSISGQSISDVRKEMQVLEPVFYKWAKETIKEDINNIKYSGVTIHSDEAARTLGGILLQAKTQGFLIGIMAQDREWTDKLFIDHSTEEDGVPYADPIAALMEGRLDRKLYEKMEKDMSPEERTNPEHWKSKAIATFKKNSQMREEAQSVRKFVREQNQEEQERKKKKGNGSEPPPTVELDP